MKRIAILVLAVTMIGTLYGCSGNPLGKKKLERVTQENVKPIEVDAAEYVKLGQYKGLTIQSTKVEVTEKEIDDYINEELKDYAEPNEDLDRSDVQEGDYVNIDYVSVIDGKKLEDYCDENLDIEMGKNQLDYLNEDLKCDDALIGKMVGDVVKVKGTVAEDYEDASIAGKDVEITITINDISIMEMPELTDQFVQESMGMNSVKEYRASVKEMLEEEKISGEGGSDRDLLWKAVLDNAQQIKDFPKETVDQEILNLTATYSEDAIAEEMEVKDFIQESFQMSMEEFANQNLKAICVMDLLAEELGISVSDKELDEQIDHAVTEMGYESKEEYLKYNSLEDLKYTIQRDRILDELEKETTFE